jgi:hypothetical protein
MVSYCTVEGNFPRTTSTGCVSASGALDAGGDWSVCPPQLDKTRTSKILPRSFVIAMLLAHVG